MSMTQVAFVKKAKLPTVTQLVEIIGAMGYDFKILEDQTTLNELDGLRCSINGQETWFEMYVEDPKEIVNECDWITADLSELDLAISFIWGADYAAGACIGLISIALIDEAQGQVYYMDDAMLYTKKMLLDDTPQFLNALNQQKRVKKVNPNSHSNVEFATKRISFWDKLKNLFKG